ncbi:MAG: hypothetical protein J6031_03300 [Bacteroidales bacterium]|nr:hypothetical protein [Bacteroidales bacterium]
MKLIRKIFGGISLTAAMFVFQACYGTPSDGWENCTSANFDVHICSAEDGSPIEGIRVQANLEESGPINHLIDFGVSDSAGYLHCDPCIPYDGKKIRLVLRDLDEIYVNDTVVVDPLSGDTVNVFLQKAQ